MYVFNLSWGMQWNFSRIELMSRLSPLADSLMFWPISILVCFRILLVFIAILSAYSIHLLLKSAGVVGKVLLDRARMN